MTKQKSRRKFALIEKELMYSKAWIMLTHSARVVYVHLKGEYTGVNGDALELPYLEPRKPWPFGMQDIMSRASFYDGIKKLEEVGFIDCVSRGQKTEFKKGQPKTPPSVYKLSGRWRMHGRSIEQDAKNRSDMFQMELHDSYCERQEDETEPEEKHHRSNG